MFCSNWSESTVVYVTSPMKRGNGKETKTRSNDFSNAFKQCPNALERVWGFFSHSPLFTRKVTYFILSGIWFNLSSGEGGEGRGNSPQKTVGDTRRTLYGRGRSLCCLLGRSILRDDQIQPSPSPLPLPIHLTPTPQVAPLCWFQAHSIIVKVQDGAWNARWFQFRWSFNFIMWFKWRV